MSASDSMLKGSAPDICSKKTKVTIIVLVVVALIQSFTLVGVTLYWSCVRSEKLRGHEQALRVTTDSILSRDVDVMPKGFEKFELDNNGTEYVGSASDILTALSNAAVADHYNGDATPETIEFHYNLPSDECKVVPNRKWIKLTQPGKLEKDPGVNASRIHWDVADLEGSQNKDVLSYDADAGAVVIEKNGSFFVTSQIEAECLKEQENESRIDKPLKIHIILESGGKSRCLKLNARSKCDQIGNYNLVSSSIGAVFKLRAQDRLFVAISNQNETDVADKKDESNSYFAVYAL